MVVGYFAWQQRMTSSLEILGEDVGATTPFYRPPFQAPDSKTREYSSTAANLYTYTSTSYHTYHIHIATTPLVYKV